MIPNPRKSVEVAYSMQEIKVALDRIAAFSNNKYRMTSANHAMEIYTFSVLEFLSIGALVDVNLISKGERTEINIEVRRAVGTFDQPHEVSSANGHISFLMDALGKLLANGRDPEANPLPVSAPPKASAMPIFIFGAIIIVLVFAWRTFFK